MQAAASWAVSGCEGRQQERFAGRTSMCDSCGVAEQAEPQLRSFYQDACGVRFTDAALLHLVELAPEG